MLRRATCARSLASARLATAIIAIMAMATVLGLLDAVPAAAKRHPMQLTGELSVEEGYTDNVRGSSTATEDAFFTTLHGYADAERHGRGWLPHHFGGAIKGRIYSEFSDRDYVELTPHAGYDWGPVDLTVDYRYSPERLRIDRDAGDNAFADEHEITGELRTKWGRDHRWTAALEINSEWSDYSGADSARDSIEPGGEAWIRFRPIEWFVPRAGISYSMRDSDTEDQDREEIGMLVGADSRLFDRIRLTLRYERGWRNYTVESPLSPHGGRNDNFGRDDDIDEIETAMRVDVPWLDGAQVVLRYRYREVDSTRVDHSYNVNEAGLGFFYAFN